MRKTSIIGKKFFSDETIIELHPRRRQFVRSPPGKLLDRKYLQNTAKFGAKRIMFWGYIKFTGEKNLVIVTGSLNSEKYMDILKEHLLEDVREGDLFQLDNVRHINRKKLPDF